MQGDGHANGAPSSTLTRLPPAAPETPRSDRDTAVLVTPRPATARARAPCHTAMKRPFGPAATTDRITARRRACGTGYPPAAGLWSAPRNAPRAATSVPRIAAHDGVVATAANPFELNAVKRPDHLALQYQLGHALLHMDIIHTIADMTSYSSILIIGSQNDSWHRVRLPSTLDEIDCCTDQRATSPMKLRVTISSPSK